MNASVRARASIHAPSATGRHCATTGLQVPKPLGLFGTDIRAWRLSAAAREKFDPGLQGEINNV